MTPEVDRAVKAIRETFDGLKVLVEEDGGGGAYVIVDGVDLGPRFIPMTTWIGGHLTAQVPYSDIYPLFVGGDIKWADGRAFAPPISSGHSFRGRTSLQISRKSNRRDPKFETPVSKFNKVLHWLRYEA